MGIFRDYLNEARDKSVPAEFRIAIGQLKRMYNAGETPDKKELEKDAEMIAKKNHLDSAKFVEFALSQFKINEALSKSEYKNKKEELIELLWKYDEGQGFDKKEDIYKQYKQEIDTIMLGKIKLDRALDLLGFKKDKVNDKLVKPIYDFLKSNLNESNIDEAKDLKVGDIVILDVNSIENSEYVNQFPGKKVPKSVKIISPKINVNGDFTFEVPKYRGKEAILPKKFIMESAVGKPGRTTEKDAEEHINDELVAEFKKIIKKLGGKTVAKVLLDKLGQKAEIKDEIDHIEDIIDNSNY